MNKYQKPIEKGGWTEDKRHPFAVIKEAKAMLYERAIAKLSGPSEAEVIFWASIHNNIKHKLQE